MGGVSVVYARPSKAVTCHLILARSKNKIQAKSERARAVSTVVSTPNGPSELNSAAEGKGSKGPEWVHCGSKPIPTFGIRTG